MKKKIIIGVIISLIIISSATTGIFFCLKNSDEDVVEKKENKPKEEINESNSTTDVSENELEEVIENETVVEDNNKTAEVKKEEPTENTSKQDNSSSNDNINNNSVTSKTLISKDTTAENEISYKYGVKITTTKTYLVSIFSDGSVDKQETNSKVNYDQSSYSATTSELKSEAQSISSNNASTYNEVLTYVNTYRAEVGKQNLTLDSNLSLAATIRALEMAWSGKFSHTRPNGSSCFTVLKDLNISYSATGENIAYGYSSAVAVSEGWKNSSGHYQNMISANYNKIGIGMAKLNGSIYWVQLFSN